MLLEMILEHFLETKFKDDKVSHCFGIKKIQEKILENFADQLFKDFFASLFTIHLIKLKLGSLSEQF